MLIKSKNELEPGQTYYAVQGVRTTVVNTYVYHPTEEEQICNCEHTKTIANWACFTTKDEADALANTCNNFSREGNAIKGVSWLQLEKAAIRDGARLIRTANHIEAVFSKIDSHQVPRSRLSAYPSTFILDCETVTFALRLATKAEESWYKN